MTAAVPGRSLVDALPVAVIELDCDRLVRSWNRAAERIFGWTAAEAIGRPNPIVPEHEWEQHLERTEAVLAGEATIDAIRRRPTKDGGWVDVRIHCTALDGVDAQGGGGLVVIAEDVTESLRAEEDLRRAEELNRLVAEHVADAISLLDRDGNVVYSSVNGVAAPGAPPRWFAERIHPDDLQTAISRVADAFAGNVVSPARTRVVLSDGVIRTLDGQLIPLPDGEGRVEHVLSVARDVTESDRLELELAQAQRLESVGRLSAGIAHDFNNLLTAITGYAELARTAVGDRELGAARAIDRIIDASQRAARLTQQLLAFSRRQVLRPARLDLNQVLNGLSELVQRLVGDHVQLRLELADGLPLVFVDQGQVEQVVINLAINARDSMPDGGVLRIGTSPCEDGFVALHVTDEGHGMDAETAARIFDPFFSTKSPDKGAGLGLASVYGIVTQSGGTIAVESTVGSGTTFRVRLPCADGDAVVHLADEPASATSAAGGGGESILVVEDMPEVREVTAATLAELGYSVHTAEHGAAALALLDTGLRVDLVLTDIQMPELNGHRLARMMRTRASAPPILFMSGDSGPDEDDLPFLRKPFSRGELAVAVREALDGAMPRARSAASRA